MKVAALAMVLAVASPLTMAMDRYVAVQGEASRAVAPDEVSFTLSFSSEGEQSDVLLKDIEAKAKPFLAAIKKLGVADKDIQGTRFDVSPRYVDGKAAGLRAQQSYRVTVHDFDLYPKALKVAVDAHSDGIGQVQLAYSGQDKLYRELLAQAVMDAKSKAALLANAGGTSLGKMVSVDEQGGGRAPVVYMRAAAMESGPMQTPGTIDVSASVSARFAIKD